MWNASAEGAEELALKGDGWRARLRNWALVQREMLDRHPWITQMPMAAPPMAPNSLTFVEKGLEALDGSGIADADKLRVIGLISSYTLSEARMAHDAARATQNQPSPTDGDARSPSWTFESLLRELIDQPTYPLLHQIAWSEEIGDDPSGFAEQEEYQFGLDRILDGVQTLINSTQQPRGPAT
jgi:Tetracyclin repressor-like, C-terminal domain